MSDLSMYELEDIIWDEFDRGDDHIVPHPTNARTSRNSSEEDGCLKHLCETTPVLSNTSNLDASHTVCEEKDFKSLDKKTKMMEKESPSQAPHGVFNDSCDGEIVKDMPNLASDDIRMPDSCFKSSYAASATDNSSYGYPLTQISQPGDLSYYSWPDIGNFEDVDKMLRSCDSSFGLGVTDNDDELGWFTSDQTEATEESLKMHFEFLCPEPSGLKNILHLDHDSPESSNHRSSCISESKDVLSLKDQITLQKQESKHHDQTEGANHDGSFYQIRQQHYRNQEHDYFGHLQFLPPDYPQEAKTLPKVSGTKSKHKGIASPSPMGSSYASNQSSADLAHEKMCQSSKIVSIPDNKQVSLSVKEHKSRKGIEGDHKGVVVGSLNVQESSSVSTELDEISLEATSFRQLRQVMEQLDLRTKLCIRDSLYRLARSAEQRHNNPTVTRGPTDVNDLSGPSMSERTNKCTGFMDMETDTNPIDRSVAHLLFHRPSESLNLPTPLPHKPNLAHGPIPGRSIQAEKQVREEEAATESHETIRGE